MAGYIKIEGIAGKSRNFAKFDGIDGESNVVGKFDGIDGESSVFGKYEGVDGESNDREWLAYPGPDKLVRSVREAHPLGVHAILFGTRKVPGYRFTVDRNGIIAILIGLLLPAVQSARSPGSADRKLLGGMLVPRGEIGFAMDDGKQKWIEVNTLD